MKIDFQVIPFVIAIVLAPMPTHAESYSAQRANGYVRARDYQGLLHYAEAWSKADPASADAWSYLGVTYGNYLKQPAKAVGPMRRSLSLNPNQAPGWHALGVNYIQLQQNSEAVNAISKAIKLNPDQPTYYNNLSVAYAQMARWQDAYNALNDEKELARKIDNPVVWYNLGNGYARLEQAAPAVEAYQQAIRLNPRWAQAWTNLGTMLQWSGNIPGAEQAFTRGAQLGDPQAADNHRRLRQALAQQSAKKTNGYGNSLDAIINRQARQNLENRLHNEGSLNINDHLQ